VRWNSIDIWQLYTAFLLFSLCICVCLCLYLCFTLSFCLPFWLSVCPGGRSGSRKPHILCTQLTYWLFCYRLNTVRCTAACTDKVWSRRNVSVHTVLTYLLFCHADSTNTARCAAACINQVRRWQSVSVRTVLTYLLFCYVDSTNTARCAAACSDKVRSRRGVSVCVALHNLVPTVIVLNVIKYLHSGCTGERQGPNQDWRIRGNHLLLFHVLVPARYSKGLLFRQELGSRLGLGLGLGSGLGCG